MKLWLGRIVRLVTVLLTVALLAILCLLVVIRTAWFRDKVRERIITETEKATGGKASLGSFAFNPATLEVTVTDFVLRGKEAAADPPLADVKQIRAGLTLASVFRREIYLARLEVKQPRIRIVTYDDGSNNIPGPKIKREGGRTVFELFIALAARRFVLETGRFEYDNHRLPLDLLAENLRIEFGWDGANRRYLGTVAASPFRFHWPKIAPLTFDTQVQLAMQNDGLVFQRAEARSGRSRIVATGSLKDYRSPKVDLDVTGDFEVAEYVVPLKLPISPEGKSHFQGRFTYDNTLLLTGTMVGTGLAVRQGGIAVAGIDLAGKVRLDTDSVRVSNITGRALDGSFDAQAAIESWRDISVTGSVAGLSLEQLRTIEATPRPLGWSGTVSGPVSITARIVGGDVLNTVIESNLDIAQAPGKIPLKGTIRSTWKQAAADIEFKSSTIETPRSRVEFSGSLGDRINLRADSEDLNDFLPAMALASPSAPASLPVQLDGGEAHFQGVVIAPTGDLEVKGRLSAGNVVYQKRKVDRVDGDVVANQAGVAVSQLRAVEAGAEVAGQIKVSLDNWKVADSSAVAGDFEIVTAPLTEVMKKAGRRELPLTGDVKGTVKVTGTAARPVIDSKLALANAKLAGESLDALDFDLDYAPDRIEIRNGAAVKGGARIPFEAVFHHPPETLDSGKLEFHVKMSGQPLGVFEALRQWREFRGTADFDVRGVLDVQPENSTIQRIDGNFEAKQLTVSGKSIGSLRVTAVTQAPGLRVEATGDLAGVPFKGSGEWQLAGDAPGLGQLDFGTLSLAKVREVTEAFGSTHGIPFDGRVTGTAVVNGPLRKPEQLRARVTFAELEMRPNNDSVGLSEQVLQELTLRSNGPITLDYDSRGIQVSQAQFTGKDTNLQLAGGIGTSGRSPFNLTLKGGLNLGLFQNYVPGLRTAGTAVLNASIRGSLDNLLLGGRMEVKDATVYHRDFSNGVDKANGLVTFDRNRALLQNLTAQSGGGELKLSGFVTFGTKDEPMSYRLNSQADKVRIRYPEGASTTVNANMSLTGTARQSLMSGTVTVLRSGFTARTDIGAALLEPAKPVQAPTGNAILQGMQFDVRVNSAPNLQLETSLTSGLGATIDLRVRGSPIKPVVLGNVAVTQGEINFFGTRYNITRGTVSFFNSARVEPVLDLDLETSVRAVTVNLNVSGPMDKLNITYRSDPPLQTQDIIALLAVGRTPGSTTVAPQSNVASVGSGVYAGTETLLGQAVSAGVSSRLNRFFGVSRVKIDPQLTGLDSTPQARLTIEQQISRDITLTYVTNLTGALQQLVRLQWDVSRAWSVTGTRDENGVIGADILFRKRFK